MVDYKEDLETVVDKLYEFVNAGGKVTVKEVALALSITEEQAEKLALILEESGLIEIQYTLAGSVLMPKKTPVVKPMIPYASSKQAPKESEALEDVRSVENVAEFIEKDFIERLSKARKSLDALSSKKDLSPKDVEALKKELAFLQDRLKNFESSVHKIELGETSFEQQLQKYSSQLSALEKMQETEKGKAKPSPEITNFLAFLIIWLKTLIASLQPRKQAQKAEAQKTAVSEPAPASKPQVPSPRLPSIHALDEFKIPQMGVGVPTSKPAKEKAHGETPAKRTAKKSAGSRVKKPARKSKRVAAPAKKHAPKAVVHKHAGNAGIKHGAKKEKSKRKSKKR